MEDIPTLNPNIFGQGGFVGVASIPNLPNPTYWHPVEYIDPRFDLQASYQHLTADFTSAPHMHHAGLAANVGVNVRIPITEEQGVNINPHYRAEVGYAENTGDVPDVDVFATHAGGLALEYNSGPFVIGASMDAGKRYYANSTQVFANADDLPSYNILDTHIYGGWVF